MKKYNFIPLLWFCFLLNFNCTMSQKKIRTKMIEQLPTEQAHFKDLLSRPETKIEALNTPFFSKHQIFKANYFSPVKPVIFYLASGPDNFTTELTSKPAVFSEVVKRDQVDLNSPELATAFVRTYFEVCRDHNRLVYLVESSDEIRFRPNLDAAGEKSKNDILEAHGTSIQKMTATPTPNGYSVQFYIISEQELQLLDAEVSKQGDIQYKASLVAENLPTVYSR